MSEKIKAKQKKKKGAKEGKEKEPEKKAPDLSIPIAMGVLERLGKPDNLHEVKVHHLWDNRYRVNVWVKVPSAHNPVYDNVKIQESFFVWATETGEIAQVSPEIEKRYKKSIVKPSKVSGDPPPSDEPEAIPEPPKACACGDGGCQKGG
jgi:arginyl-tRNA synthetase